MPNKMEGTWEGGFTRRDAHGRLMYVIRRSVGGKRYDVSTRCTTLKAAMEQLKRFEADPASYRAAGEERRDPIYLDAALTLAFLTWSRDVQENSAHWVAKQKRYLAWWAGTLKGLDLRRVSLALHIKTALDTAKGQAHRIAVLKALYSWLRKERHTLTADEDPTFGTLAVPQSDPNARALKDKSISRKQYLAARKRLDGHWRDALDLQAGTGWHVTEVQRFAKGGAVEAHPRKGVKGVGGVLVCPETKAGGSLRTAVGADVLAAAKRLRKRGTFGTERYGMALKAACEAAVAAKELKPHEVFTPGRMRHSVATWAINAGADPATVSAFLNHKSPRTTRKFYATHAVPTKVPTLR